MISSSIGSHISSGNNVGSVTDGASASELPWLRTHLNISYLLLLKIRIDRLGQRRPSGAARARQNYMTIQILESSVCIGANRSHSGAARSTSPREKSGADDGDRGEESAGTRAGSHRVGRHHATDATVSHALRQRWQQSRCPHVRCAPLVKHLPRHNVRPLLV